MSDIDPLAHPPVFKYDQIITRNELVGMVYGFEYQLKDLHWWEIRKRRYVEAAIRTIAAVLDYLDRGKR
jgi:hypothetical protein